MKKFFLIASVSLFLTAVCAPVVTVSAQEPQKKECPKTQKECPKTQKECTKQEKKECVEKNKCDAKVKKSESVKRK